MTDTLQRPHVQRRNRLEWGVWALGESARPFAIVATAFTTAWAVTDPGVDSAKLTAAGIILAALYASKTIENQQQGSQQAKVEIAKAEKGIVTPPAAAVISPAEAPQAVTAIPAPVAPEPEKPLASPVRDPIRSGEDDPVPSQGVRFEPRNVGSE